MSSLYILEINPWSVPFAKIFSYSVGCLFVLQKLFIRSHLYIFVFMPITQEEGLKKILLQFMLESELPMFSSKNFKVSSLTFRCLIYFEFTFVYGVKQYSNLIFFHVAVQFSQHHLLKRLYLLYYIVLPPLLWIDH